MECNAKILIFFGSLFNYLSILEVKEKIKNA
jgi:hypothetical protein